jgi:hypothetical protein
MRRQLADLLIGFGHEVIFYQKPLFFFENSKNLINRQENTSLELRQTRQLMHHQLRIIPIFEAINSCYESKEIIASLGVIGEDAIVINFNYDYVFLRKLFKYNKIVTIINDDFVAQARILGGRHVVSALKKVSSLSDAVLCVSYPLLEQVASSCRRSELFLPWTDTLYVKPKPGEKDSILVWASINNVLDFGIVRHISCTFREFKVFLVGPLDARVESVLQELLKDCCNVFYFPPKRLEELTDLSKFFVGLMPYRAGVKSTVAVTAANKTFRLMSLGLPLVVHGMPRFYEHESIFKSDSVEGMEYAIRHCHANFDRMQLNIEKLVNRQKPSDRYDQIMSVINED